MKNFFFNQNLDTATYYWHAMHSDDSGKVDSLLRDLSENYVVENTKILVSAEKIDYSEETVKADSGGNYFATCDGFAHYDNRGFLKVLPLLQATTYWAKLVVPYTEIVQYPVDKSIFDKAIAKANLKNHLLKGVEEKIKNALQYGGGKVIDCAKGKEAIGFVPPKIFFHDKDVHRCYYAKLPCLSYEEIAYHKQVEKQEAIGDYEGSKEEQNGIDIYGNPTSSKVKEVPSPIGEGLVREGGSVVSTRDGFVCIDFNSVAHIRSLDIIEGNLKESYYNEDPQKDLFVTGDISSRFRIVTEGNVYIVGNVEGGMIIASGDIILAGGVMQNAFVESGKNIELQFASHTTMLANGAIRIRKYSISCSLYAGLWVDLLDEEHGLIAGSHITVGGFIRSATIGSKKGHETRLESVNGIFDRIGEKKEERYREIIDVANHNIHRYKVRLGEKYFEEGDAFIDSLPEKRKESFRKSVDVYQLALKEKEYFETRLTALKAARVSSDWKKIKENLEVFVEATNKIFSDVRIVLSRKDLVTKSDMEGRVFYFYDEEKKSIVAKRG